jgi:uncharacterized protein
MRKSQYIARLATACAIVFLIGTPFSAAQESGRPLSSKPAGTQQPRPAAKAVKPSAAVPARKRSAFARMTPPAAAKRAEHHLILQVNTNDPAAMNLALNNATNVTDYYKELGEKVQIEVVTFGPGLHMLREDTSPVKARIETMALSTPEVSFKACGNTQEKMRKAEDKDIPIIPQAQMVKSGVVHVMQREEQGWTYVKP